MRPAVRSSFWLTLLIAALTFGTAAHAAFVTTNEAAMDTIYSQAAFGVDPIDIVWNPVQVHVDPNLLNINTSTKLNSLFALFDSATEIYAYFVDTVDFCGTFNTGFVGCGDLPGDDFVVESVFAAGSFGAELNAHELGHNLNLDHSDPNSANLMFSTLNGDTSLTVGQANIAQGRPQVQGAAPNRFVVINPILLQVPEPSTALLLGLGLLGLRARGRRS